MPYARRDYPFPFFNVASSVAKARFLLRTTLLSWEYGDDVIEPALLIMSELATNAVLHATESAVFKVVCELQQNTLTIGVIDYDSRLPTKRDLGIEGEGGRGLLVVETLADDWGCQSLAPGKLVFGRLYVARPPIYAAAQERVPAGLPLCST